MKQLVSIFLAVWILFNISCKSGNKDSNKSMMTLLLAKAAYDRANTNYDSLKTYYTTMTNLNVEVIYESDASPFNATFSNPFTGNTKYVWDILDDNLKEMFKNRSRSVTTSIPKTLSSMTSISSQGKTKWTISDMVSFAKQNRKTMSTETTGSFFVAFVNGYYSTDGSSQSTNVIGVNLSSTPYIFIFKQVVNSTGDNTASGIATKVYVEQSTLVHEMGHALGLVNNGVTMTSSHQDTSNGKHCTNTTCVMYYANEGTTALVTFLNNYIQTGSTILFKSDCLNDTQQFNP